MLDAKQLRMERKELFEDLFDGIIPKRVPIMANLPIEFCMQYSNLPLAETQWTLEGIEEALDKACQMTSADYYPSAFSRYPAHLQILGSRGFVMGSNGFIQHPEVTAMDASEYDEFIKNPYDCLMEKVLPRLYPELNTDPIRRSIVFAKAFKAYYDYIEAYAKIDQKLIEKYGFHTVPRGTFAGATTPFDFISDFLRGFKEIALDIKRCPEKIIEACEAALPLQIKKGMPPIPSKYGHTFIALHMGTYLRTKDFEKLYWPTFSKMVHALAEAGQPSLIFCEHDWMRYLDYLQDLPENTRLYFEFGDPKLVKEKLGKKHIISGFYPITYLKTATKEQCIDKAKELIDILAPGGRYYFTFDKTPVTLDSINVENYAAVLKYVVENSKYDNAGEKAASEKISAKTPIKEEIPEFKSKYYMSWNDYKEIHSDIDPKLEPLMAAKLQTYEDMVFRMLALLV
ncbi:uroporphyrinogen decarboxylase family protein [Geosporobacter ferrireducens]|uniref:Uroporphyrinogen decarboxylase n=1 Tax=Geosporobacter ferrireducens TaxID=1424294 RepID=A0A1D8GCQ4_9FIRM|nr:uroporphyrinogen decarboxylase family protein [Geosporobacter ferrireducens]AOT68685.1 uroporphyrinogen decarboxylase [Geosporobacter ferrireducens]MTI57569.1 uroporphyrinogen decarboxylase [Geosporobacter ferrireducens]